MKFLLRIDYIFAGLCAVLLPLLLFIQVVSRSIFSQGLPWLEEVLRFLFLWFVYVGSLVAMRGEQHFRVVFIYERCPRSVQFALDMLMYLLWGIFSFVVVFYGVKMLVDMASRPQVSPILEIDIRVIYAIIPVVFFLHFVQLILFLVRDIKRKRQDRS